MRHYVSTLLTVFAAGLMELEWYVGMNWQLVEKKVHFGEHPRHGQVVFIVHYYQHMKTGQRRQHLAGVQPIE